MNEKQMRGRYVWQRDKKSLDNAWRNAVRDIPYKIIVLDDDPTGIQTSSGVPVYTQWNRRIIRRIDKGDARVTFVWTNSRALPADDATALYRRIAADLLDYYKRKGSEFIIISRSDSTLRGNYPQETQAFFDVWRNDLPIDAEIITPYFPQAGRYTFGDVHYVSQNGTLVPCAQTEFAKDKTFGYTSSDLKEWIAEKHGGNVQGRIFSVGIETLRGEDDNGTFKKLTDAHSFDKIVVNAIEQEDLNAFIIPLSRAIRSGKRFIFRTAASFVNAIGGIPSKDADVCGGQRQKGLFLAGSHTALTTAQITQLLESGARGIELPIADVFEPKAMKRQRRRICRETKSCFNRGQCVCIYTPRKYQTFAGKTNLQIAQAVSREMTVVAHMLAKHADYIVAKGGITSHDIATRGLGIGRATVLGQVLPGVPVIRAKKACGRAVTYTIFPGNVGADDALVRIKEKYESG